jgi:hypothetical protein
MKGQVRDSIERAFRGLIDWQDNNSQRILSLSTDPSPSANWPCRATGPPSTPDCHVVIVATSLAPSPPSSRGINAADAVIRRCFHYPIVPTVVLLRSGVTTLRRPGWLKLWNWQPFTSLLLSSLESVTNTSAAFPVDCTKQKELILGHRNIHNGERVAPHRDDRQTRHSLLPTIAANSRRASKFLFTRRTDPSSPAIYRNPKQ